MSLSANQAGAGFPTSSGPVDINSADAETLTGLLSLLPQFQANPNTLHNVVKRIINNREARGPFTSLENLGIRVKGLGKGIEKLRGRTTLGSTKKRLHELGPDEIFGRIKSELDVKAVEDRIHGASINIQEDGMELLRRHYGFSASTDEIREVFEKNGFKKGDTILDIGPGQMVLSMIAAIMGAKVTVVEPSKEYLSRMKAIASMFINAIRESGGAFNFIEGNINDASIESRLLDASFDHVICLDVINNSGAFVDIIDSIFGADANAMEQGIHDTEKQKDLIDTILRVIKREKSTIYFKTLARSTREFLYLPQKIRDNDIPLLTERLTYDPFYPGKKCAIVYRLGMPETSAAAANPQSDAEIESYIEKYMLGEENVLRAFGELDRQRSNDRRGCEVDSARLKVKSAISILADGLCRAYFRDSDTIIDLGAGAGWVEQILPERAVSGKIIPFDENPKSLEIIKQKELCQRTIEGNFVALSKSLCDAGIPTADAMISCDALDTLEDLEKAVEECYAVLKPGGRIIILQSAKADPRPIIRELKRRGLYQEPGKPGVVYCPQLDAFFPDRDSLKTVARAYLHAVINNCTSLDDDWNEYARLCDKYALKVSSTIYFDRLEKAMKAAGFSIFEPAHELEGLNVVAPETCHQTLPIFGGDEAALNAPINIMTFEHGILRARWHPRVDKGKVCEYVKLYCIAGEKAAAPSEMATENAMAGWRIIFGNQLQEYLRGNIAGTAELRHDEYHMIIEGLLQNTQGQEFIRNSLVAAKDERDVEGFVHFKRAEVAYLSCGANSRIYRVALFSKSDLKAEFALTLCQYSLETLALLHAKFPDERDNYGLQQEFRNLKRAHGVIPNNVIEPYSEAEHLFKGANYQAFSMKYVPKCDGFNFIYSGGNCRAASFGEEDGWQMEGNDFRQMLNDVVWIRTKLFLELGQIFSISPSASDFIYPSQEDSPSRGNYFLEPLNLKTVNYDPSKSLILTSGRNAIDGDAADFVMHELRFERMMDFDHLNMKNPYRELSFRDVAPSIVNALDIGYPGEGRKNAIEWFNAYLDKYERGVLSEGGAFIKEYVRELERQVAVGAALLTEGAQQNETSDGSRDAPTSEAAPPLKDEVLRVLPEAEQSQIDTIIRFMGHVVVLSGLYGSALGQHDKSAQAARFDNIPGKDVMEFLRELRANMAELSLIHESWSEDPFALLSEKHELFSNVKATPRTGCRVLFEAYKRGSPLSEAEKAKVAAIDRAANELLFGERKDVTQRLLLETEIVNRLGAMRNDGISRGLLDRLQLYVEKGDDSRATKIARTFLAYYIEDRFASAEMKNAFLFNRSIVEGFLTPGYCQTNNVGVVYLLANGNQLCEQAKQIAEAVGSDALRMHAVYVNQYIGKGDQGLLRRYVEEQGLARYNTLVIVATGFHSSSAKKLESMLRAAPDGPKNIHTRFLYLSDPRHDGDTSSLVGWNNILELLGELSMPEDYEKMIFLTHILDDSLPGEKRSPVRLEINGRTGKVEPDLIDTELPLSAQVAKTAMREGTAKLLAGSLTYPDPRNPEWSLWLPGGAAMNIRNGQAKG